MVPTRKARGAYAVIVLLVQAYLVYAATLYVEPGSAGFLWILCAASASAAGAGLYLLVLADAAAGEAEGPPALEERRRVG